MFGKLSAILLLAGFVVSGIVYYQTKQYYKTKIDSIQSTLTISDEEVRYHERKARQLETDVFEARTLTFEANSKLAVVADALSERNKELNRLRKYSEGTEISNSETDISIREVRDTTTVVVAKDSIKVSSDFVEGMIIKDVFTYRLKGIIEYTTVTNKTGKTNQVIGSAFLVSGNKRIALPIKSTFMFTEISRRSLSINPSLNIGFIQSDPAAGISLFSYGTGEDGRKVYLSFLMIGATIKKPVDVVFVPVNVNAGRYIPVVHTLNVGFAMVNKSPGIFIGSVF